MSRIQDALKRAQKISPRPAPGAPVTLPVPGRAAPRPRSWLVGVGLGVGLLATLGLGLLYWQFRSALQSNASPPTFVAEEIPTVAAGTANRDASDSDLPATGGEIAASPPVASPAALPPAPAATSLTSDGGSVQTPNTSLADAAPPLWRLQGILYHRNRPAAVLNGQTVFVGDTVAGARVVAIEPERVRLLREGEEVTLSLKPPRPGQPN